MKSYELTLLFSSFGIFLLLIFSIFETPPYFKIKDIKSDKLGKFVQIKGKFVRVYFSSNNFQILIFKDFSGEIKVLIKSNLKFKKTQEFRIIGKIKKYKNELEIDADKVFLLRNVCIFLR